MIKQHYGLPPPRRRQRGRTLENSSAVQKCAAAVSKGRPQGQKVPANCTVRLFPRSLPIFVSCVPTLQGAER
jgi:hypothetical protein